MKNKKIYTTILLCCITAHVYPAQSKHKKRYTNTTSCPQPLTQHAELTTCPISDPLQTTKAYVEQPEQSNDCIVAPVNTPAEGSPAPSIVSSQNPSKVSSPIVPCIKTTFTLEDLTYISKVDETMRFLSDNATDHALGWDRCTDEEPATTHEAPQSPTLLEKLTGLYDNAWDSLNQNGAIDRLMRTVGVKTYAILLTKVNNSEFTGFISNLNDTQDGEGSRWIDAALQEAINENREDITTRLLQAGPEFIDELSKKTREKIEAFLQRKSNQHYLAQIEENEIYASHVQTMSQLIAAVRGVPFTPKTLKEIQQSAQKTTLELTQCASNCLVNTTQQ